MRIKKAFQGKIPENKIMNVDSDSETDTYSCKKINEMVGGAGSVTPEDVANWNAELTEPDIYSGTTVPDATIGKDGDIYILYTT